MIVYRTAQWCPEVVTHVFSVCTPFAPTSDKFISTADIVRGPYPQFGYQLQLAGPDVQAGIQTRDDIRHFLNGMYGGRTEDQQVLFNPETGINLGVLSSIGNAPLFNEEVRSISVSYDRELWLTKK